MLMMIFMISLFALFSFEKKKQLLQQQMQLQKQYYTHYHLAASVLAWGGKKIWQQELNENWQCETSTSLHLSACIRKATAKKDNVNNVLVKGESGFVTLYLLTQFDKESKKIDLKNALWLDYCPEKDKNEHCE